MKQDTKIYYCLESIVEALKSDTIKFKSHTNATVEIETVKIEILHIKSVLYNCKIQAPTRVWRTQ